MRKRSDKHWEGKLVDEKTDCFRLKIPKGHKTIKNAWPKKKMHGPDLNPDLDKPVLGE